MPLDVHPQLLRALRAVLDTGSLTAASERLGFTQSALSKQIAVLEAAAGVRLLERGARGVTATAAGRRLAIHAAAVLDQLDVAARELDELQRPLGGRVVLGGFPAAAMGLIPRAIARLHHQHPSIAVDFAESSTPVQIRRLRAGRLDLAVIAAGDDLPDWGTSGIELEPLPSGHLVVAVSEDHRLAGAVRVDVSDLDAEDWIAGRGARGEPQFGAWPTIREPRIVAELSEWSARLGFVAAGLGITTVPSMSVDALPRGVTAVMVTDLGWRGRSMQLARRGELDPAGGAVREAVIAEAEAIAARGAAGGSL
ncbi:LysR family transcriptional regulator [Microbacterium sp. P06]|uniref:LysR family transcriptional regulator n=1 Tax=Microbacterium sp. P06 TaxID=3366949 RepID=UPI00374653F9